MDYSKPPINYMTPKAAGLGLAIAVGLFLSGERYRPAAVLVIAIVVLGWFTARKKTP